MTGQTERGARARWPWLLALLALAIIPLAARLVIQGRHPGSDVPVQPAPDSMPAAAARLAWQPVAADAITAATDFTVTGDTLVILDGLSRRIVMLRWGGRQWEPISSMGRRGGGPGELLRPHALALAGDSAIAVVEEGGRMQLLARDGTHLLTEAQALPCPMFAPIMRFGTKGRRFAAGNCPGTGASSDTVFTLLFTSPRTDDAAPARGVRTWEEMARVPRIALDLSWGSTFATLYPLTSHGDTIYFGTGVGGCLARVALAGPGQATSVTSCDVVAERFHAPAPEGVLASQRRAREKGDRRSERALAWPDVLPAFMAVVPAEDGLLLLRPVGASSLLAVPAAQPFDPASVRLAAPLDSFVNCTEGICLWYEPGSDRIAVVRFGRDGSVLSGPGALSGTGFPAP